MENTGEDSTDERVYVLRGFVSSDVAKSSRTLRHDDPLMRIANTDQFERVVKVRLHVAD